MSHCSNMAVLTLKEEKILCEKIKQYQILFDKQLKGCCDHCMVCSGKRKRNWEVLILLIKK